MAFDTMNSALYNQQIVALEMASLDSLVNKWLDLDRNPETCREIKDLYANHEFEELKKRLTKRIQFGTAGLRAAMGAGFSLMNDVTVLQASQGLAKYVKTAVENADIRGVVIGHDHRHHSARFADLACLAFAHVGIVVYRYDSLVHTPMVPFGVDHLNAACGVMITASHNPAKDNGYKVYWSNGCQIIPPHDEKIANSIEDNLEPWTWDLDPQTSQQYVKSINLDREYLAKLKQVLPLKGYLELPFSKFVYTPMHGVGLPMMRRICTELLGSEQKMVVVAEQADPDPDFSTVKFPNPEEKGALDLAMKTGDGCNAQFILASDPDADRFSVAVYSMTSSSWIQLTGNQIGSLFAYDSVRRSTPNRKMALVNSTVSSQLMAVLAQQNGIHYEDTLTGFKWIGNKVIELEQLGYYVPFAYEEALGYMFPVVHDKDGLTASAMFLLLISENNITTGDDLLKLLDHISQEVGYFEEHNDYYISPSPEVTKSVFDYVRSDQVDKERLGTKFKVTSWRDLTIGYDSTTKDHKPKLPVSSNSQMITVSLALNSDENVGVRFTARGSGTEPKLKVYIEARGTSRVQAKQLADEVWDSLRVSWFKDDRLRRN